MSKYGVIAKFDNPQSLVHAAEKVRDEGFTKFDCHSPFPTVSYTHLTLPTILLV